MSANISIEQIAYQKSAVLVLCLILRNDPICIDLKEDISVKYFPSNGKIFLHLCNCVSLIAKMTQEVFISLYH